MIIRARRRDRIIGLLCVGCALLVKDCAKRVKAGRAIQGAEAGEPGRADIGEQDADGGARTEAEGEQISAAQGENRVGHGEQPGAQRLSIGVQIGFGVQRRAVVIGEGDAQAGVIGIGFERWGGVDLMQGAALGIRETQGIGEIIDRAGIEQGDTGERRGQAVGDRTLQPGQIGAQGQGSVQNTGLRHQIEGSVGVGCSEDAFEFRPNSLRGEPG